MKKILSLTLALGLVSPLYADNTKRQEIIKYIEDMKISLESADNEVKRITLHEAQKFPDGLTLNQRKEIADDVKIKITQKDHTENYRKCLDTLKAYENDIKNMNDAELMEFEKKIHLFYKKTLKPFTENLIETSHNEMNTLLSKIPHCPNTPFTSKEWRNLKDNGFIAYEFNGKPIYFAVEKSDKNNFPDKLKLSSLNNLLNSAWNSLVKSVPIKKTFDIKNIDAYEKVNKVTCQYRYEYHAGINKKTKSISIYSTF